MFEKIKNLFNKKQNANNITNDDIVKILSALYTYNHGNKICKPIEYSCNAGCSENGGGDFSLFEREIQNIGYFIEEIVYVEKHYKLKKDDDDYQQRKKNKTFFPSDVKYFVLSNNEGQKFSLVETPDTLEILAKSGDERAIGTYNNWMEKINAKEAKISSNKIEELHNLEEIEQQEEKGRSR